MNAVRASGVLLLLAAASVACVLLGEPILAVCAVLMGAIAASPRAGGAGWLAVVGLALGLGLVGLITLDQAALIAALSVLAAGLSRHSGVAVVGGGLLLALVAPQVRDVGFALPLGLWAGGVVLLLVGDHTRRVRAAVRPVLATTAVALLVVGLGFALVPRVGVAEREQPALTGFQARVDLDDVADLLDDPTPIARVEVVRGELTGTVRLRGVALEHFDGHQWTAPSDRRAQPNDLGDAGTQVRVVPLGRIDEGALLALGPIAGVDRDTQLDGAGNRWAGPGASRPYTVALGVPPVGEHDATRWLSVPADLDPRVVTLAGELAGEQTAPLLVAQRMVDHLRTVAIYTRRPIGARADDPVADFLFGQRAGHCEHWASALTLLLRARGIQARPVNGFVGLEDDGNGFLVRRSDAHAWVEVRVGGAWVAVDPTPSLADAAAPEASLGERVDRTWEGQIIGWDAVGQRYAARQVMRGIASRPWLVALGYGAVVLWGVWRIVTRRRASVAAAHQRVVKALHSQGLRPPPSLPPVDAARWVVARLGPDANGIEELAWMLYAVRYGGRSEDELCRPAQELARDIVRNLPRLCSGVSIR